MTLTVMVIDPVSEKTKPLLVSLIKERKEMEILKSKTDNTLVMSISGRLDTATAPQLEEELKASLGDSTELILDLSSLEYMSSAGLRILLSAQKTMNSQGKMLVKNVNDTIMEIFEVTGFTEILTIEN